VELIRHQESVKGIGIFTNEQQDPSQLPVYRALLQDQIPRRMFSLWFVTGDGLFQLAIYPFSGFSCQWSAKPIWDSLQGMERPKSVWRIKLYLTCLSDEGILRSVLASIAQYFPQVSYLELMVHDWNIHLVRFFFLLQPIVISNLGYALACIESSRRVVGSVTGLETSRVRSRF
jgi:hypothetical protein